MQLVVTGNYETGNGRFFTREKRPFFVASCRSKRTEMTGQAPNGADGAKPSSVI